MADISLVQDVYGNADQEQALAYQRIESALLSWAQNALSKNAPGLKYKLGLHPQSQANGFSVNLVLETSVKNARTIQNKLLRLTTIDSELSEMVPYTDSEPAPKVTY